MTEGDREALEAVAGDVSRETIERFMLLERRLRTWNRRINLMSAADLAQLWSRHIIDCAQLVRLAPADAIWLDIGSGAGFPGLVVAAIVSGAGGHVHLVESNRKKAAFLAQFCAEAKLDATIHACRVEALAGEIADIDIVTARAVAPLRQLLELAEPWLSGSAHSLFQKGREYGEELKECHDAWRFDLVKHPSRTDPAGVILEISRLRRIRTGETRQQ